LFAEEEEASDSSDNEETEEKTLTQTERLKLRLEQAGMDKALD